jgi:hypothetical protein
MSRLTVEMPSAETLGSPVAPVVAIHDERLRLVASARVGESVKLRPGRYLVSGRLPDGERVTESVELGAGDERVAILQRWVAGTARGAGRPPHRRLPLWERLTAEEVLHRPVGGHVRVRAVQVYARAVDGDGRLWTTDAISALERHAHTVVVSAPGQARGSSPGARFLQVAVHGRVPALVALPVAVDRTARRCVVDIRRDARGGLHAAARMPSGKGQLIAAYLTRGAVAEAAEIADTAQSLLFHKLSDPLAAAVGGYALLRLGRFERLHDWPTNLARWFPQLPDGAVIAAMQAIAEGDEPSAVEQLATAVRRGTPIFSIGLSLLVSALRTRRDALAEQDLADEVARLLALAPHVDYGQLTTSFHAADVRDPTGSQHPLEAFPSAEGWLRLDRTRKLATSKSTRKKLS